MKFELLKVLDKIIHLYKLPRNRERFDQYLYLLKGGNKDEMHLPIAGYNPMGKELALQKSEQLMELHAEEIVMETLQNINFKWKNSLNRHINVAINLVDDLEGSWSNFAVTDYKNKFEFDGLIKRGFCTPIFWTSETINKEIIVQRTNEFVYRTIYWLENGKPESLSECLDQEIFVNIECGKHAPSIARTEIRLLQNHFDQHTETNDYNIKLNFFYGDEQTQDLNFPLFGIPKNGGFQFAQYLAFIQKTGTN